MADQINYAGEVRLTKCNLISSAGTKGVDITNIVYHIEIFEDIFSNSLSGNIILTETYNLRNQLPLIGEEILEIEFNTPTFTQKFTKSFYVYRMTDHVIQGDKKMAYCLHFMSLENVYDLNTKLSRSFLGNTHEIATSLFNQYVRIPEVPKEIYAEESSNKIKFVANFWSPYKCLNYAASRSTDMTSFQTPNFLFFESRSGFNFRSLNSLMKAPTVYSYLYDTKSRRTNTIEDGCSVRDINQEYHSAFNMIVDEPFDYITRELNGVFSHKVIQHNLLNKNVTSHVYNYWNDFEQTNHLGVAPLCSEYVDFNDTGTLYSTKTIYPSMHNNINDISGEIVSKRISLLGHPDLHKIKVVVAGRTDIEVGQVVEFKMAKYGHLTQENKNDDMSDKYWSGNYLITNIKHQVTAKDHQMTLSLSKDAIDQDAFKFGEVLT